MIITRSTASTEPARRITRVQTWVENGDWYYRITIDGVVRDCGVLGPVDE